MKVAVVFVLLFVTVLSRPARKDSSSESSEEVVRRPAAPVLWKQAAVFPEASPVQNIVASPSASSDESSESSDEDEQTAAVEFKSEMPEAASSSDTASVSSNDSEDSDDGDDTEETETEEDEDDSSDSSESDESSTAAPTFTPDENTPEPIEPTIVTDAGRGDNLGGYPSDHKSIVYVEEDKSYHKVPGPYKSYEYVDSGKKTAYDGRDINEVEKSMHVYKVQVHPDFPEEDSSTPEVESQGLENSSQDQNHSDATTSESESSSTAEEEEENTSSASQSASQESEDEESQSSEEATATAGAADSESDESESSESDSNEEGAGPDAGTNMPEVVSAK